MSRHTRVWVVILAGALAAVRCVGAEGGDSSKAGKAPSAAEMQAMRERYEALALVAKLGGWTHPADPGPREAIHFVKLSKSKVTDADLAVLAGLRDLGTLGLSGTAVTDEGLKHVSKLSALVGLELGGTKITDRGLRHLAGLRDLGTLRLERTKITADGLRHLAQLRQLSFLDVSGTSVRESDLAVLAGLRGLHVMPFTVSASRAWLTPPPFVTTDWVASKDGRLSLRLLAPQGAIVAAAPIVVLAELRNNAKEAVNVLRPFGDRYTAEAAWIRVVGPKGVVPYSGPTPSYPLGSAAFATLRPGEVIRDRLVLPVHAFAGSDQPGKYQVTFRYEPTKSYGQTAAHPRIAKPNLWIGRIDSKSVAVVKQP